MERVSKVLLILATVVVVLALDVEGRKMMKSNEQVDHPQNFYGGAAGGVFPGSGPGFGSGIGFGPSGGTFCTLPGGCVPISVPVLPTIPGAGGSIDGGSGSVPLAP